ncbi:MAG TPA: hypothetical protein VNM92_15105 [Thermoanaerobaculia bacterium]|nr:hypothetical protein [Thermoanaerobaculia bacterium]
MQNPEQRESSAIHDRQFYDTAHEEGSSVSYLVHTLRRYAQVIAVSLLAVMSFYLIVALLAYLLSPSQKLTSLPFRLEFEGSNRGEYPNGTKFSTMEITATPVLLTVYRENDIGRFMSFERFARGVFVLESSSAKEQLALEYQARLADTKLNPVDRERIQKEYDLKRASLSQADYSLNFMSSKKTGALPRSMINKVLTDSLDAWARYAASQKRALQYRVAVLSANIIEKPTGAEAVDYILGVRILRSRIHHVMRNIDQIKEIPGAELARTSKEQMSLDEARLRLEDIVRFRLEPLVGTVRAAGLVRDPASSVRFLEEQLFYDTRDLKEAEERSRILRDALTLYTQKPVNVFDETQTRQKDAEPSTRSGQTIMPQLGESFLDRLVNMTGEGADREYRQKMVDEIKAAGLDTVPLQSLVEYDRQLIEMVKKAVPTATPKPDAEQMVQQQFDAIYGDVSKAIANVNEIYTVVSRNLNPSTELFTLTAPPSRRTERTVSLPRLGLYGVLTFLLSIALIIGGCLLHNRMREEEAEESAGRTAEAAV